MSLARLMELRMSGRVPTSVSIVVGNRPAIDIDEPWFAYIGPGDNLQQIDWRPLVGLHVDVFENGDHNHLFERVANCIDSANPRSTGLAKSYQLVSGINEHHELLLRREWELFCLPKE